MIPFQVNRRKAQQQAHQQERHQAHQVPPLHPAALPPDQYPDRDWQGTSRGLAKHGRDEEG
jgi:hypothetical protein